MSAPTFATFHAARPGEAQERHFELVELMFRSARLAHPGCRQVLLTDRATVVPPRLDGIDVVRSDVPPGALMLARLEAQVALLAAAPPGAVVLLDSDMLVAADLAPVLDGPGDLAVTFRADREMPINGGFLAVTAAGRVRATAFLRRVLGLYRARFAGEADWWGDQRALVEAVGRDRLAGAGPELIDAGDATLRLLPCASHNFSPPNDPLAVARPIRGPAILHFKGERKALMPAYWRAHLAPGRARAGVAARPRTVCWFGAERTADAAMLGLLDGRLRGDGLHLRCHAAGQGIDWRRPPAAIVVTGAGEESLEQVRIASRLCVPVLARLTDDRFAGIDGASPLGPRANALLRQLVSLATCIVSAGPAATVAAARELGGRPHSVEIPEPIEAWLPGGPARRIPDGLAYRPPLLSRDTLRAAGARGGEALGSWAEGFRRGLARLAGGGPDPSRVPEARPRRHGSASVDASAAATVVWFGTATDPAPGSITDLAAGLGALARIAADAAIRLVVVSDDALAGELLARDAGFATSRRRPDELGAALADATAVLLPLADHRFARSEPATRAVAALSAGVPVVASATPALAPLAPWLHLGDLEAGLRRCLADPAGERARAAAAGAAIADRTAEAVAASWAALILRHA